MTAQETRKELSTQPFVAALSAVVAVLLWGAWFPLTKIAVSTNLNEIDLAFVRFATAGLVAVPILMRRGFRVPGDWGLAKAIVLSQFAGVGYVLVAALALRVAPGAYGMVTPVSMAMFSSLLAMIFGAGRRNGFVYASYAVNVAALTLLVLLDRGGAEAPNPTLGIGLFVVAGFLFSLYNFFVARWSVEPLHATALVSFYSAVVILPIYVAVASEQGSRTMPGIGEILFQMAYQGILVSYVALLLFTSAVQTLGIDRAVYLALAVPAIAVGLSLALLGERAEPAMMVSIAFLIVGMGLGIYGTRHRSRPTPNP